MAKWLRILGYDVLYEKGVASIEEAHDKRIRLTRTRRVVETRTAQRILFITSNDSFQQLIEVVQQLEMTPKDFRPFTRCILCNTPIVKIDKVLAKGRVPDYIWEIHDSFKFCCRCDKIYWPGDHTKNTLERIKHLFLESDKSRVTETDRIGQTPGDRE